MRILLRWVKANSVLLINAGSLVGTSTVTSLLGFVYWLVAARQFPPEAVGIASASVSAMTLLGNFCIMGLGTLLITELPRQPDQAGKLISTALIVVGVVSGCVGIVFAVIAPYVAVSFKPLGANILDVFTFASGLFLASIVLVLDQALVALLHGGLQLWRNTLFAVIKLVALFVASLLLSSRGGMAIYTTWTVGNALSLLALAVILVLKKGWSIRSYLPQWGLLRKLGFAALQHHFLNLTLQASVLILPMLVTTLLSATMNAWFYVAWMIANFVFLIPYVLTIVLHAMNAAQQSSLAHKARVTISMSLIVGLLVNCLLQLATKQVLGFFGESYVQGAWCLRIIVLAVFPLTIKNHYIAICRIYNRLTQAMLAMLPGGLLEISAAVLGAHLGGLTGLSAGWVAAIYVESLFAFPTVCNAVFPSKNAAISTELQQAGAQVLWQMDTIPLPVISTGHTGVQPLWLMDTIPLPIVVRSCMVADLPRLASLPMMKLPSAEQASRGPNTQSLQVGASRHKGGSFQHLKASRLRSFAPFPNHIPITPITDPSINDQILEGRHDNSTIFVDEVI